jgi:hypothetical protein
MSDNPNVSALARFQEHLDAAIEAIEAKQKQSFRLTSDSWEDLLLKNLELKPDARHNITQAFDADGNPEWRVRSYYLLTNVVGIAPERVGAVHQRRLGTVMRKLGWSGPKNIKFGTEQAKGYSRAAEEISP